jgi:hypothetical protein
MAMEALDPKRWAEMIEAYFGKTAGRALNRTALLFLILGAIGLGGQLFFKNFIAEFIWPALEKLFGANEIGISLDNIEAIIAVLVASIVAFVVLFAIVIMFFIKVFRRRVVSQETIDELAEFRSEGISILNLKFEPSDGSERVPTDVEADIFLTMTWEPKWTAWKGRVVAALEKNFTKAEQLSFERLGIYPARRFRRQMNPEHGHYLGQLAQQITVLEDMIQRYQERR